MEGDRWRSDQSTCRRDARDILSSRGRREKMVPRRGVARRCVSYIFQPVTWMSLSNVAHRCGTPLWHNIQAFRSAFVASSGAGINPERSDALKCIGTWLEVSWREGAVRIASESPHTAICLDPSARYSESGCRRSLRCACIVPFYLCFSPSRSFSHLWRLHGRAAPRGWARQWRMRPPMQLRARLVLPFLPWRTVPP